MNDTNSCNSRSCSKSNYFTSLLQFLVDLVQQEWLASSCWSWNYVRHVNIGLSYPYVVPVKNILRPCNTNFKTCCCSGPSSAGGGAGNSFGRGAGVGLEVMSTTSIYRVGISSCITLCFTYCTVEGWGLRGKVQVIRITIIIIYHHHITPLMLVVTEGDMMILGLRRSQEVDNIIAWWLPWAARK